MRPRVLFGYVRGFKNFANVSGEVDTGSPPGNVTEQKAQIVFINLEMNCEMLILVSHGVK
ncbi:hypothetical protein SU32_12180 [Ahrensia marina]|uniref:Uncharacterized protein n=1 Tax=Ahrensia marina TaxID=1514904 RepID=A0A0N0VL85_9HYPH|nr:hypothetical protein SU32_12180 [Ahrensia marina]